MEQNIVILLDYENQKIRCYGQTYVSLSFSDSYLLKYILQKNTALYITSADEVDFNDIKELTKNIPLKSNSNTYLKSNVEGYLNVKDIQLTFAGPKDLKLLSKLGKDIFEKSDHLQELLRNGKISILNEEEAKNFKRKVSTSSKDDSLRSIILDKPVDKMMEEIGSGFDDSELDEIGEDTNVETDAESIIKNYGIGRR